MKKLVALIICMLVFVTLLSGCGYRDIDKRFFVVAIGIDKSADKKKPYHVSLKLAIPSAQVAPGHAKFQIISENADSIPEAVRVMKSKVDKEFDFGHCRIILFDKKVLQGNINELINWFMRRRDIQGISYLGIGKPSAEKVLQISAKSERLPANALLLAFDDTTNTSPYIVPEILNNFYMRLHEEGVDPYLPIVQPIKDSYLINTVALFKGHTITKGLDMDETRMLNELMNTSRRGQINVVTRKHQFFVNVDRLKSDLKVEIPKNERPYAKVTIKIEGFIEGSGKKLNNNYELKQYQKVAAQTINKRVKKALIQIQKLESDPLGLGLLYQAKHGVSPKDREQWKEIYRDLDFHVKTDLTLRGSGTLY
jgi:spore germination protein KC